MRISFAIDSEVIAGRLVREALRLNCDPRQLGVALVTVVLDGMLVDSVLDGDDPKRFAREYVVRRNRIPIEDRLDEVMLFIATRIHESADGRVVLGVRDLARGLDTASGVAARAVKLLVDEGRLIASRERHRDKTTYSLPASEFQ